VTRVAFGIAAAFVAVQMVVSARYGYHRDELYFVASGRRLAWGYVDQPPLSPAVARLSQTLFGDSLVGLRLFPALAGGGVVLLTALIARELGGGPFAQALAALAAAVSGVFLGVHHLAGPTSYDQLAWAGTLLLGLRILGGGDPRLWLAVGAIVGVGLLNKHTVLFLVGGLAVGLLAVGPRDMLRSGWLWAGIAIALVIWLPNLLWQVRHDWATLEMTRSLREKNSGFGGVVELLVGQVLEISPVLVPLWIVGLVALLRGPELQTYRSVAVAYFVILAVLIVSGGKFYYLAPIYTALFAAGAVTVERVTRDGDFWLGRPTIVAGIVVLSLPTFFLALPVVPVDRVEPLRKINWELGETVGWPTFVDTVAGVYDDLSPGERDGAVIFTRNYGEAGAVDRFGDEHGLPRASSGHNNYWWWGPPESDGDVAIVIGVEAQQALEPFFETCELATRIDNGLDIDNEEQDAGVYVCRGRRAPWAEIWPDVRHYN